MKTKKVMNENMVLAGQITFFDLLENSAKLTKVPEMFTKNEVLETKMAASFTKSDINLTFEQQRVYDLYLKNENLTRMTLNASGGLCIELKTYEGYKFVYVNKSGKEEFVINKKITILPWDKILHSLTVYTLTNIQEERLNSILSQCNNKKVILRKGDENVLIELESRIIRVNPEGLVLEFKNCEVIYFPDEVQAEAPTEGLEEIQQRVKVGDEIEAEYGKEKLQGTISRVYGPDNLSLNIVYKRDERKYTTAICRLAVNKILRSA